MANQAKKTQVDSLLQAISDYPNFLLISFEKTSHQTLEGVRKDLKKNNSFQSVVKNTLFEKAINKLSEKNTQLKDFRKKYFPLTQTTGLLTLDREWDKGLHVLYEVMKKEKTIRFKNAVLDGKTYSDTEVETIAKLPTKDQLAANLIGSLKSPSSHFVYALKFNINKLVYILKAKSA